MARPCCASTGLSLSTSAVLPAAEGGGVAEDLGNQSDLSARGTARIEEASESDVLSSASSKSEIEACSDVELASSFAGLLLVKDSRGPSSGDEGTEISAGNCLWRLLLGILLSSSSFSVLAEL